MNKLIKIFIFIIILNFISSAGSLFASKNASSTHTLRLLVTSDIHGWFTNQVMYPRRKSTGLFHIADYIKQIKMTQKNVILLDAGDMIAGSPLSIYYNHLHPERLPENPFFKLLNALKYDVIVPGNHDLEHYSLLEQYYISNSNAKWLAANIVTRQTPVFHPYQTIHQGKFKIVIIGATTPGILMWSNISFFKNIKIISVKKALDKWIKIINREIKPDFLILAIHGGINPMRDHENGKLNRIPPVNDIRTLLPDFPEVDLVISGHDHQLHPYHPGQKLRFINNRPVISGGKLAEAVINISLDLIKGKKRWKIKNHQVEIYKAVQYQKKPKIIGSLTQQYLNYINEPLKWVIQKTDRGTATRCLNKLLALAFNDKKSIGSLFPSIGKISIRYLKNQILKRKHIYRWLRYPNRAVSVRLSWNDIYLLTHPKPEFGKYRITYNRHLFSAFNTEGMTVIDKQNWWPNREDYNRDKVVKISDYHFYGGGGVLSALFLKPVANATINKTIFQEQLIDYLNNKKQLKPESCQFLRYQSVTPADSPK
jgi:2',3'-cyclic-nucleotide 2'-phosphodiesterase (5'-nucleotidase family)